MKLWLLEILACPICHAFPLELTIFHWEGEPSTSSSPPDSSDKTSDRITNLIDQYHQKTPLSLDENDPTNLLHLSDIEGESVFRIRDSLVIKPTPFPQYLTELIAKIEELHVVWDKSSWSGQAALDLIQSTIATQLKQALEAANHSPSSARKILDTIHHALVLLNRFKYEMEIEDAVIRCPECKRWFPVFETIPQMLPDDVRDKTSDDQFRTQWKALYQFE